jgi:hypothetical protein
MNITDRAFILKASGFFLVVVCGIISLFLLVLLFWSLLMGGLFLTVLSLLLLAIFAPLKIVDRQFLVSRVILAIATIVMLLMFSDLAIVEAQRRFDKLEQKVVSSGAEALSFGDKLAVYNTNLVLSFYGRFLGFPEYAYQSFRLNFKTSGSRHKDSDFAMRSPKVRETLRNWVSLTHRHRKDVSHVMMPTRKISWQLGKEDRRAALALNPVTLKAKACPTGQKWRFDCEATTYFNYSRNGKRFLISAGNAHLILPEGPFWVLQNTGWLKPYTIVWEWTFYSDDNRL